MKKIMALVSAMILVTLTPISASAEEPGTLEAKNACIAIKAAYEGWLVTGERVGTAKGDAKYNTVVSRITSTLTPLKNKVSSQSVTQAWSYLESKGASFKPVHVYAGGLNFLSTLNTVRVNLEKARSAWLPSYGTVETSFSQNVEKPCSAYTPVSKGALKGSTIDAKVKDMASRLNGLGYKCTLSRITSADTFAFADCGRIAINVQDDRGWDFSKVTQCWANVTLGTSWRLEVIGGPNFPSIKDSSVAAAVKFLKTNASKLGGKLSSKCTGK